MKDIPMNKKCWAEKCDKKRDEWPYCKSDKRITKDHKIPLTRGGSNWIANLAPACLTCNDSKGTKTYNEFIYGQTNRL